ncbi:MAG: AAA family ATPase [Bryobacterales bacterium]|nr:AAA family ATPase [Gammaproteobacteria bacterium]MDE0435995.1 AAA family ATPase [Bryobacterales bacterium]
MSRFQFRELHVENFRCFGALTLPLEEDTTILFGENGGGKTALLNALAIGLAVFQRGLSKRPRINAERDPSMHSLDERGGREATGRCELRWTAAVGETESVTWSTAVNPGTGSPRAMSRHRPILEALEQVRVPGKRWPLFAWYGVDRLRRRRHRRKHQHTGDRWSAYDSSLDPSLDEAPLLEWLQDEALRDAALRQQSMPERLLHQAVMDTAVRATPGVANAWHEAETGGPMVRFEDGHMTSWPDLSHGNHALMSLVADIARRAVKLNEFDGAKAPARVEGVVLIDGIDLHLHPRWQRIVLSRLRDTFPRLQFVVSTRSPQVLSSAQNRQVRRLVGGRLQDWGVFVSGRDSNAILRELMNTDDRDERGTAALRALYEAIDRDDQHLAAQRHEELVEKWGYNDPELIRARGFMEE